MVPSSYYLGLSAVLFTIGVAGVLVRRNLIVMLMSIELMLNAVTWRSSRSAARAARWTAR